MQGDRRGQDHPLRPHRHRLLRHDRLRELPVGPDDRHHPHRRGPAARFRLAARYPPEPDVKSGRAAAQASAAAFLLARRAVLCYASPNKAPQGARGLLGKAGRENRETGEMPVRDRRRMGRAPARDVTSSMTREGRPARRVQDAPPSPSRKTCPVVHTARCPAACRGSGEAGPAPWTDQTLARKRSSQPRCGPGRALFFGGGRPLADALSSAFLMFGWGRHFLFCGAKRTGRRKEQIL